MFGKLIAFTFVLSFVVLCSCPLVTAADKTEEAPFNALAAHSTALLFNIHSGVVVGPWRDMSFGIKHQFDERTAIRIGFDIDWSQYESEQLEYDPTPYDEINKSKWVSSSFDIDLMPQLQRYIKPAGKMHLNYALGITTGFHWDEGDHEETDNRSSGWEVGPTGSFGGEWFVNDHIAFTVEYLFQLIYRSETYKSTRVTGNEITKQTSTSSSWNFESSTARLGLSLYF